MMRRTRVDFSKTLREWDGFGVNYVEVAQTRDYDADPQEYGGFSILTETQRREIIDLIFGEDGPKPGLIKVFLDSFHQAEPGEGYDYAPNAIDLDAYDHTTTTRWMNTFVREGLKTTRERGGDLEILTTLYGPPAWTTKQKFVRCSVLLRQPPAIDEDARAGDETGGVAGQEERHAADLLQLSPAPHRDLGDKGLILLRILKQRLVHLRPEWSRQDRVDGDSRRRPLQRQCARQLHHGAFAGRIGCALGDGYM